MKKNIEILDCTLRDGGYYNNWDFSKSQIQKYINEVTTTGIEFIELGFRFSEITKLKGLTAYTEKNLINSLIIPKNLKIGVMINASDLLNNNSFKIGILKKLMNKNNINKIKFVRIACHHGEVTLLKKCFEYLKSLNLKIFVNIMQISEIKFEKFKRILLFLRKNKIEVVYLADSLGCLKPKDLNRIISILKKYWKGEVGLHAHNNLKLALKNSLIGIKKNFKWIDCTVTGMGRGPGNLKTEDILKHVEGYEITNKFSNIKKFFEKLKKKYKWGPNKFYKFAAIKKIHPTYIQQILSDKRYLESDYSKILSTLSRLDTKKYNPNKLVNSAIFLSNSVSGSWSPESILKNRNVLILGPGKNLKINKKRIEKTILKKNLFVICLNNFSYLKDKYINLRAICHPLRIVSDKVKLKNLKTKIAIPITSISKKTRRSINIKKENIYDYGLTIGPSSKLVVKNKYCVLPNPLAIGYTLSLVISGKAKSVKLAGFDGYEKSDPDHDHTEELLKMFVKKYFKRKLISLTKTKFNFLKYKTING